MNANGREDEVPSYVIIDSRNKPFGAVLPIDVQNRIMWMAMKSTHADGYKKVMEELRKLPVCSITDWCNRPNEDFGFGDVCLLCTLCDRTDCTHARDGTRCHWCKLYCDDNKSLYELEVARKLQVERDSIGCYEEERYRQFVHANKQRFADSLKFTFVSVILPMLCFVEPRDVQSSFRIIRDEKITFEEIFIGFDLVLSDFVARNGLGEFKNPRDVSMQGRKKVKKSNELEDVMWRVPPTQEELEEMSEEMMENVERNVDEFLYEMDS